MKLLDCWSNCTRVSCRASRQDRFMKAHLSWTGRCLECCNWLSAGWWNKNNNLKTDKAAAEHLLLHPSCVFRMHSIRLCLRTCTGTDCAYLRVPARDAAVGAVAQITVAMSACDWHEWRNQQVTWSLANVISLRWTCVWLYRSLSVCVCVCAAVCVHYCPPWEVPAVQRGVTWFLKTTPTLRSEELCTLPVQVLVCVMVSYSALTPGRIHFMFWF